MSFQTNPEPTISVPCPSIHLPNAPYFPHLSTEIPQSSTHSPFCTHGSLEFIKMRSFTLILVLAYVLADLVILNRQHTHTDTYNSYKRDLSRTHLTNAVVQTTLALAGHNYWCYVSVANTLVHSVKRNLTEGTFREAEVHLKELEGLCTKYYTREFVYELCYGAEVRQLDDEITKRNMNKPAFENFLLGKIGAAEKEQVTSREQQPVLEDPYLYVSNGTGRFSFDMKLNFDPRVLQFSRLQTVCDNGVNLSSDVVWIGKAEFVLLNHSRGECYTKFVTIDSLNSTTLLLQQAYQLLAPPLLSFTNSYQLVNLSTTWFHLLHVVELDSSLIVRRIRSQLNLLEGDEILKQCESARWPPNGTLTKGDRFVVLWEGGPSERIEVVGLNPLKFSRDISSKASHISKLFRIHKPTPQNYTKQETEEPLDYYNLLPGDTLSGLTSSDLVQITIQIPNKMATLLQPNGWQYLLISNGRCLRRRVYSSNHSKEIQMSSQYYENDTTDSFTLYQGIAATHVNYDQDHSFSILPLKGEYRIVADSPTVVKVYDTKSEYNQYKVYRREIKFPEEPLKISQMYAGGDHCPPPVDAPREATVVYKCGNSWFKITDINEKKPCSYQLVVETKLLCPEESTFNEEEEDNKDTLCFNEKFGSN